MRIFQTFNYSATSSYPKNLTWYRNLYEPLLDLGHDVYLYPADEGFKAMINSDSNLKETFSQKLLFRFLCEHKKSPFDLFFSYLNDDMVDYQVINEISKTGVVTCNFSCNNTHQFHLINEISPYFNYSLHSEKDCSHKFKGIGANPLFWPMASNPKYFFPIKMKREIDVSFVGANYPPRAQYIYHLILNGILIHIFGAGWRYYNSSTKFNSKIKTSLSKIKSLISLSKSERLNESLTFNYIKTTKIINKKFPYLVHSIISDTEMIKLYSSSKISLGILDVYENHEQSLNLFKHLHLREFEALMSGALYCTGFSNELAEMFEPNKEILTYKSKAEMIDIIKYYLINERAADKIRLAGHRRALTDHTYHLRFQQLFNKVGLNRL